MKNKTVRKSISIVCGILSIISFLVIASESSNISTMIPTKLIALIVFALSILVAGVCDDPNIILRHIFAIWFCINALRGKSSEMKREDKVISKCYNTLLNERTYHRTYRYALRLYDDKLYEEF